MSSLFNVARTSYCGALVVVVLFAMIGGARGQEIVVTKSFAAKTSLDISAIRISGANGALFLRTLQNDLSKSSWFSLVGGNAAYAVAGNCILDPAKAQAGITVVNNANRQTPLSQTFVNAQGDAKRLAHTVADAIIRAITGQRGLAGCRLVIVGDRTGSKELYICDSDGGNLQQWTKDRSISLAPAWHPGGDQIIYTSFLKGFADMYLVNLSSGQRTCIAKYPGINMGGDISPDGREIAMVLSKDGSPDLYIRGLMGGGLTRLTRTKWGEASPSWSPDGSKIVYVADRGKSPQLYIVSRSGGEPRQISSRGSENVAPDWGANGLIAYTSRRDGHYAIMVYDPARGTHTPVTQDRADYEDPSWAPDGRHIFCARTAGRKTDVYMLDIAEDSPVRLSPSEGNWRSPACSP